MTIDASAVARVTGIEGTFKDLRGGRVAFLPQRIAVFAQGCSASVYSLAKFTATSSRQVGALMGYGSPANLILRELLPDNGDGVGTIPITVYPLEDAYEAVAASGTITPSGTPTAAGAYRVRIGGVLSEKFIILEDASVADICDAMVAAINAVLHMPVIASDNTTNVGLLAKWAGESGNDLVVEVLGDMSLGTTFTMVQPTGGLANPAVDDALELVGGVWETMFLNALNPEDEDALDAFQTFGDGRWLPLVKKPMIAFHGSTIADDVAAVAITSTRTDDKINCQLVAPGSPNLPCVVAARQLVRIAKLANNNPPHDYGSQRADGLIPGADELQWDYAARDRAVKGGSSTIEIKSDVVNISDVVTSWAPEGEPDPAYRFVVDIVKLQQVIYNLDLIFNSAEWDGAPMIPDDQPTVNPTAKKPKMAKAAAAAMIDDLGLQAILSDPKGAKASLACNIVGPKRWNLSAQVKVSGNSNVKDINFEWGFDYGTQSIVG